MAPKDIYDLLETKTLLYGEQYKGLLASLGSGSIASILNLTLTTMFKWNIQSSTFLSMYVIGNLLTYSFDILFAKEHFYDAKLGKNIAYKFNDFTPKIKWLIKSFVDKYFMRYFLTVMIDSIIGLAILKWTIKTLDDYNIYKDNKFRDVIAAILVSVFCFVLYLNALRFNWAYTNNDDPIINMLVLIWFTLALLIMVKFEDLKKNTVVHPFSSTNFDFQK